MSFSGEYEVVSKTPMGEQQSIITVHADGDTFTGNNSGPSGTTHFMDGRIEGNVLTWKSKISTPLPLTLEGRAVIEGDEISGTLKAGLFGKFPLKGKRKA